MLPNSYQWLSTGVRLCFPLCFQTRMLIFPYWFSSSKSLQNRWSIYLHFWDTGFLCDESHWPESVISGRVRSVLYYFLCRRWGEVIFICLANISGQKLFPEIIFCHTNNYRIGVTVPPYLYLHSHVVSYFAKSFSVRIYYCRPVLPTYNNHYKNNVLILYEKSCSR